MGILSNVVKGLRNTIRGVGRVIKKVTKPLRKAIRAVLRPLKPVGKFFNRLGFVGTIALSFIIPGIGGMLGTWLSSIGPGMAKFVSAMSRAINWVTKPIQFMRDSITGVLKQGMNKIGQAFGWDAPGSMKWVAGGEPILDAAGNVTGTTTGHFAAGEAVGSGITLTDSLTNMAKKIFQRTETATTTTNIDPLSTSTTTTNIDPLSTSTVKYDQYGNFIEGRVTPTPVGTAPPPTIDYSLSPGEQAIADSYKPSNLLDPTTKLPIDATKAMEAGVPQYKNKFQQWQAERKRPFQEWQAERERPLGDFYDKTLDPKLKKLSESPFGKTVKYGSSAYGAYSMFKDSPSYEEGFYNPNIAQAGYMLDATQQGTYLDDLVFGGKQEVNTGSLYDDIYNQFLTAGGTVQQQGANTFGLNFEDWMNNYGMVNTDDFLYNI